MLRPPVLVGNPIRLASEVESGDACLMRGVCSLIWLALVGLFHSRVSLEAEILALRHQLNVLRRISPKKPTFTIIDRLVFAGLYRLAPGILDALVTPETVIRWHRAGFRLFWRWKSRCRVGRPKVPFEIRHVEPTGVLGDKVELQPAQHATRFTSGKGLVERASRVRR